MEFYLKELLSEELNGIIPRVNFTSVENTINVIPQK